jgi:uncharacterized protein YndB with AHSA1/START domain
MPAKVETATADKPPTLHVSRVFRAPRALLFKAWTTAEHMKRWFSPEGLTVPYATIEFRPGGRFEVCMRMPGGEEYWSKGAFDEIVENQSLSFTCDVLHGSATPSFRVETHVTFEDAEGGSRMSVEQSYQMFEGSAAAAIAGASEGWRTTLDRLGRELERIKATANGSLSEMVAAGESEAERAKATASGGVVHAMFRLERAYEAPPARVFRAFADQDAKARWFTGGDGYSVLERAMDVRPGGRERLKGQWKSGTTTLFDAIYFEVVADRRLVYAYDMWMNERKLSVSLASLEFRAEGAGTKLVVVEQGAFLDGYDDAGSRERGTAMLLDRVGESLKA